MRILVVDDNPDELRLAHRLLETAGFREVVCVDSARAACELLGVGVEGTPPTDIGVLLLDVHMPGEDGVEACRRIKLDPRYEDLAVIMVTAANDPAVLAAAFTAGAMDYITKPYARQELQARVRSAERLVATLRAHRESERRLHQITSALGEGLFVMDADGCFTFVNPEAERLLGWREEELRGLPVHETIHYLHPDGSYYPVEGCPIMQIARRGEVCRVEDDVFIDREGRFIQVSYVATPMLDDGGLLTGAVAAFQEISARKALEADRRFAARLVEASANGIMATDPDGVIRLVNPAFTRITGYTAGEVVGATPSILHSGNHPPSFYEEMWRTLVATGRWHGEVWNRRKDGGIYPEWLSISAIHDRQGRVERYMAVFLDITEHKEIESRLKHMANHDPLTGLPNRQLFADRLAHAISQAQRERLAVGVLYLDLDGFKPINDELGHEAGDLVLKEVARRLEGCARASDTVCRVGGDEFVVIIYGVRTAGADRAAVAVAEKLLAEIPRPIDIDGRQVEVGVSIGIALYPQHGRTADALVSAADTAMYGAKRSGRRRYCLPGCDAADDEVR